MGKSLMALPDYEATKITKLSLEEVEDMRGFGLAFVDTMVQEINGNVTVNFQMAYAFQKSSVGGHSMFKGVAHGAHEVAAGTRR